MASLGSSLVCTSRWVEGARCNGLGVLKKHVPPRAPARGKLLEHCMTRSRFVAIVIAFSAILGAHLATGQEKSITLFAAASLKYALDDINTTFTKSTGIRVAASYDSSSALMKQIEQGSPADVFASADLDWMEYGSQKKVINNDTRINLLGNRLVLIAPKDSKLGSVTIGSGFNLAQLAGNGRVATGDVRAVPFGKYTKAALEKLGSWQAAEPKFAMTENVFAAIRLVAGGEASLGIVYATDAITEPRVKIIGVFPADSHPEIVYPVAATVRAKPEALSYLSYLRSAAAKAVFGRYGFVFLIPPGS
jgi:molybdate transport system substrate-binding protein